MVASGSSHATRPLRPRARELRQGAYDLGKTLSLARAGQGGDRRRRAATRGGTKTTGRFQTRGAVVFGETGEATGVVVWCRGANTWPEVRFAGLWSDRCLQSEPASNGACCMHSSVVVGWSPQAHFGHPAGTQVTWMTQQGPSGPGAVHVIRAPGVPVPSPHPTYFIVPGGSVARRPLTATQPTVAEQVASSSPVQSGFEMQINWPSASTHPHAVRGAGVGAALRCGVRNSGVGGVAAVWSPRTGRSTNAGRLVEARANDRVDTGVVRLVRLFSARREVERRQKDRQKRT